MVPPKYMDRTIQDRFHHNPTIGSSSILGWQKEVSVVWTKGDLNKTKEIQRKYKGGKARGLSHSVYSQPPCVLRSYTQTSPSLSSIVSGPTSSIKPIKTFQFLWVYPRARRRQFPTLAGLFPRDFCTFGGF